MQLALGGVLLRGRRSYIEEVASAAAGGHRQGQLNRGKRACTLPRPSVNEFLRGPMAPGPFSPASSRGARSTAPHVSLEVDGDVAERKTTPRTTRRLMRWSQIPAAAPRVRAASARDLSRWPPTTERSPPAGRPAGASPEAPERGNAEREAAGGRYVCQAVCMCS
jgi:hypothetical protein